ncbi:alpha-pore-forming cytotoxin subunit MakB [Thalassotalea ganghwensis]
MLSPNIDTAINMLTDVYSDFINISSYDATCNSLVIGHVAEDPDWLTSVRSRSSALKNVMNEFVDQKPKMFADIITSFINYQSTLAAVASNRKAISSAQQWLAFLTPLRTTLASNVAIATNAQQTFTHAYGQAKDVESLINESVQEGWTALSDEEQVMVKIANQIGSLTANIESLGANVSSAQIRAGKAYIQSTVTIAYGVVMGTVSSVPFLSFAGALFTIGYSAYDTISKAQEIQHDLDQLTKLQNEATEAAQAAAITKATIQVLTNMSEQFLSIDDNLPALALLWQDELDKVTELINALESGSDPALLYDLQTIEVAAASWQTIADFAKQISLPPEYGTPVLINTLDNTIKQQ